jgi:hypothetical protein
MDSDQNTLRDAEILIAALPGGVFAAPAQNTRFSIEQAPHRFAQGYIQRFYAEHLNPSLNFHRPCAQADPEIDARGRIRRSYKRYQTTFEMLLALDQPAQYLRDGLELATLNRNAGALSDTDAARRMQQAKATLFDRLRLAG